MLYSFKGGTHPDDKKYLASEKPIEQLAAPSFVILPLSMHIGAPCQPLVQKGDHVLIGQKIADSPAPVSSPVHATISGTVRDILPCLHSNGSLVPSIIIDNDFEGTVDPSIHPLDIEKMSTDEIVAAVRNAGIVGHGGAAFPAQIKISSGLGKVDNILINCAECEPYITSDHRLLLERTEEIVKGAKILQRIFGGVATSICIEQNKQNTIPLVNKCLGSDSTIKVCCLKTKYPQGAEKQLIYAITKREVPSGKLPADAGCAVFNAATTASIYQLFTTGMPMLKRVVTVSGSAVVNPKNIEAPIGTPIENLIEACGGFKKEPNKLLMGGPMMGTALFSTDVPVIKGTNAIVAFCENETVSVKNPRCIRCGKCVEVCPMHLLPTYIYTSNEKASVADLEKYNTLDCIECGACTYVCPAKIPLVQGIRVGKQRVQEARRKK